LTDILQEQAKVDSILKWGIVFSIVWLAGIGSLIAFRNGMKARKMIKNNQGLIGKKRVMWCLFAGGLGLIFWVPIVFIGIINNLK
jgi:hypothetical protein